MADSTDGHLSRAATPSDAHARYLQPRWLIIVVLCLPVLAIIVSRYDGSVAAWVSHNDLPSVVKHSPWATVVKVVKAPGNYLKGTLPIAALACLMAGRRRAAYAAALILLNGIPVGLFYTVGKWSAGRPRPYTSDLGLHPFEFHPFNHGIRGLWTAHNQSFPSGHACLAFATATSLSFLWPRGAWLFFLLAILVGIERVLENAHYPSDVVAGAVFGIISAWITRQAVNRPIRGMPLSGRPKGTPA